MDPLRDIDVLKYDEFAAAYGELVRTANASRQAGDQSTHPRAVGAELQPLQNLRLSDERPRAPQRPANRRGAAHAGRRRPPDACAARAPQAEKSPRFTFEQQIPQDFEAWLKDGGPDGPRAQAASRMECAEQERTRSLKLDGLALGRLPAKLGQLKHLRTLHIGGNQLEHLPRAVCRLEQLQTLDASNNKMTRLPSSIARLGALKSLNVNANELESLPSELASLTRLETLCASNNKLELVPAQVGELENLRHVDLPRNRLWDIPGAWGMLFRRLEHVDLSNNRLQQLPVNCEAPARGIKLNVSDNPMETLPTAYGGFRYAKRIFSSTNDHRIKNSTGKVTVHINGTNIRRGLVIDRYVHRSTHPLERNQ